MTYLVIDSARYRLNGRSNFSPTSRAQARPATASFLGLKIKCALLLLFYLAGTPPSMALDAGQLAVLVNKNDPASVQIADYYREQRGIPEANLIEIDLPKSQDNLPEEAFKRLYSHVQRKLPPGTQALALAWTQPWRVDCMSITAAFAFGFDPRLCASGCGQTAINPSFNGGEGAKGGEDKMAPTANSLPPPLPTMMLAGESVPDVKQLVDRGVAADFSYPKGTVYLVRTGDSARNVRSATYSTTMEKLPGLTFASPNEAQATGVDDVLGYFTGVVRVNGLESLKFLPGAPADHLTSFGGKLLGNHGQMSALAWLKAGATGSYGTVVEPCNHLAKFPHPGVLMSWYANGDTLIEAYWKSVAQPGQGVFIGEPLARPFGTRVWKDDAGWWVEAYSASGRQARVETAPSVVGPYRPVGHLRLPAGYSKRHILLQGAGALRLR